MKDGRDRRVDVSVERGGRCGRLQLLGQRIHLGLTNGGERLGADLLEDRGEVRGLASRLHVAQSGFGERACSGITVDAPLEEFGLAGRPDFLGGFAVASASAFVNEEAPDGPAQIPVRGAVSSFEGEGHGSLSSSSFTSAGVKT